MRSRSRTPLLHEFVEHRDCVLRAGAFTNETFKGFWSSTNGVREAVEAVVNHVHIYDAFPEIDDETPTVSRALKQFAERMARTWRLTASLAFPDRRFEIDVTDEHGPSVTIYQS